MILYRVSTKMWKPYFTTFYYFLLPIKHEILLPFNWFSIPYGTSNEDPAAFKCPLINVSATTIKEWRIRMKPWYVRPFIKLHYRRGGHSGENFKIINFDIRDASLMSSYRCMLRPTCMFMDRMIAPINVHSIAYKLKIVYKTWQQKLFPLAPRDDN